MRSRGLLSAAARIGGDSGPPAIRAPTLAHEDDQSKLLREGNASAPTMGRWWIGRVYFLAFSLAGPDLSLTARSASGCDSPAFYRADHCCDGRLASRRSAFQPRR